MLLNCLIFINIVSHQHLSFYFVDFVVVDFVVVDVEIVVDFVAVIL